ncbi:MAG TPA: response regulator [Thermoanaerobaculia bacterium]|nr:response regulator [Thermoanaerobaculia bacterium]
MKPKPQPRILVVEDHDVMRVMLFTILRHQPIGVDTAATVADALQRIRDCEYALLVIDMNMPDAEAFLSRFHDEQPDAKTFVLAMRDPNSDVFTDPQVVSVVLNKPIEIDTLADLARECALVIPPPAEPCPPSESDVRARMDRTPYTTN